MHDTLIRPRRSLIFAPGNHPDMYPKAAKAGADIVTIDLEDAIAPQHKEIARDATLELTTSFAPADEVETIVRVNCLRTVEGLADLQAIASAEVPPAALMLPKIKSADEIQVYDELLSGPLSHIRFHVIIETNEALESCHRIARCRPRIDSLLFGGVDMAAELRVEPTWNALLYARSRVVHAAAGAGLDFIDVPFLDLSDMDGLEREANACQQLGITGKAAIHPKQIPVINKIFTPTSEDIDLARRITTEFEQGDSGLVVIDNKLIEKPVLRSMYRILAIAERLCL